MGGNVKRDLQQGQKMTNRLNNNVITDNFRGLLNHEKMGHPLGCPILFA